jgi:hypothetical protein
MRKAVIALVALISVSFAGTAANAQYYRPDPGLAIVQGIIGGMMRAQRPYYPRYHHRWYRRRFYRTRVFCRIVPSYPYGYPVRICRRYYF